MTFKQFIESKKKNVDFDDMTPVDYDGEKDRSKTGRLDHKAKKRKSSLTDAYDPFRPIPPALKKDLGPALAQYATGFLSTDKGFGIRFSRKVSERHVAQAVGMDKAYLQVMPEKDGQLLYHFRDYSMDESVDIELEVLTEKARTSYKEIPFNNVPRDLTKDLGPEFAKQALGFVTTDKGFGILFSKKVSERGIAKALNVDVDDIAVMQYKDNFIYHIREQLEEHLDEALTLQQRQKKRRTMKRYKSRVKIGRDKSKRRTADTSRLQQRARRSARKQVLSRILKGADKASLSHSRKSELEKRMDRPANKNMVKRLARRQMPQQRKKDREYRSK